MLHIAEIYREKHDFTQARQFLDKAKASDPENLEVRYDEVNLLAVEGQTDKAIEALKALLKDTQRTSYSESEKGTRINLLDRLGELYRAANQNQAAIDTFRQIADLDPDSGARAAIQIVDTYRASKDFKNAKTEADAALKMYTGERSVQRGPRLRPREIWARSTRLSSELRGLLNGEQPIAKRNWISPRSTSAPSATMT